MSQLAAQKQYKKPILEKLSKILIVYKVQKY